MSAQLIETRTLTDDEPLMLSLMEPVSIMEPGSPEMGAMTKYKTFTGEKINGQDVWNMDYADDDV